MSSDEEPTEDPFVHAAKWVVAGLVAVLTAPWRLLQRWRRAAYIKHAMQVTREQKEQAVRNDRALKVAQIRNDRALKEAQSRALLSVEERSLEHLANIDRMLTFIYRVVLIQVISAGVIALLFFASHIK